MLWSGKSIYLLFCFHCQICGCYRVPGTMGVCLFESFAKHATLSRLSRMVGPPPFGYLSCLLFPIPSEISEAKLPPDRFGKYLPRPCRALLACMATFPCRLFLVNHQSSSLRSSSSPHDTTACTPPLDPHTSFDPGILDIVGTLDTAAPSSLPSALTCRCSRVPPATPAHGCGMLSQHLRFIHEGKLP